MDSPLQATDWEPWRRLDPHVVIDGLYLHTPFCFHKCHYCDFYSLVEPAGSVPDRWQPFISRLVVELAWRAEQARLRPSTIFIGGGTPTLLSVDVWRTLLSELRRLGLLENVLEFTVEANPETLHTELAELLAAGGVNRISIGAQSFNPQLLKTLERWHDPANVGRAVQIARSAGIGNINLDLIFAIPGQTMKLLDADLEATLDLNPSHISYYNLTYEPNTAMTQRLKLGRFTPIPEQMEAEMFELLMQKLEQAGFDHYEISNWARWDGVPQKQPCNSLQAHLPHRPNTSKRCQHNLHYWHNRNWLGVGPSAASHVNGCRWKNEAHLGRYLAQQPAPPITDQESLDPERQIGEMLMLRLRLLEGAPWNWIKATIPLGNWRHQALAELIQQGMLEKTAGRLRLSRRGLFVADAVIARLL